MPPADTARLDLPFPAGAAEARPWAERMDLTVPTEGPDAPERLSSPFTGAPRSEPPLVVTSQVLFAAAILLTGCASGPSPSPAQVELAGGRALAERVCAACHALAPGEDSADPRAPPFPSREMQHTAGLAGRVAELARGGHYSMPPISLTPAEAAAVTAYIESLGEPPPAHRRD